tara:strand:- start:117634 stop:118317 length:684 start_codon:yes stop_codon:yes gene_type:complete
MISIIIPAINEEESLIKLIPYLISSSELEEIEIIISDGGSTDGTKELSKKNIVRVVQSPKKGRAAQMNYGAKYAKGKTLYFLHADSYPPKKYAKEITESIRNGFLAGCFRLTFDCDHILLKLYSWFTKFDIDVFRFGDQSLFIEKDYFEKLNGFDEKLIVMEDQMFVKEIKKQADFEILKSAIVTSSRKYKEVGVIKLQLIFTVILILFYLGLSQKNLIKLYKRTIG